MKESKSEPQSLLNIDYAMLRQFKLYVLPAYAVKREISPEKLKELTDKKKRYSDSLQNARERWAKRDRNDDFNNRQLRKDTRSIIRENESKLKQINSTLVSTEKGHTEIEFQFPPKVVSDTKNAVWFEKNIKQPEPLAIFFGSQPRQVEISFSYIVGLTDSWTAEKVANQIKTLRGQFYNEAATNISVALAAYSVVGPGSSKKFPYWTFRVSNLSISHGETLVQSPDFIDSNNTGQSNAYPLRTDVTMSLLSWTTLKSPTSDAIAYESESEGASGGEITNIKIKNNSKNLRDLPNDLGWF